MDASTFSLIVRCSLLFRALQEAIARVEVPEGGARHSSRAVCACVLQGADAMLQSPLSLVSCRRHTLDGSCMSRSVSTAANDVEDVGYKTLLLWSESVALR